MHTHDAIWLCKSCNQWGSIQNVGEPQLMKKKAKKGSWEFRTEQPNYMKCSVCFPWPWDSNTVHRLSLRWRTTPIFDAAVDLVTNLVQRVSNRRHDAKVLSSTHSQSFWKWKVILLCPCDNLNVFCAFVGKAFYIQLYSPFLVKKKQENPHAHTHTYTHTEHFTILQKRAQYYTNMPKYLYLPYHQIAYTMY